MAQDISNGEYGEFIVGEARHTLNTFRPVGGAIKVTDNPTLAGEGEGFLIKDGETVSNFDPQGRTWYAYADGADVTLYSDHRIQFGPSGGVG